MQICCRKVILFQHGMSTDHHGLNYTSSLLKNGITANAYPRMPNAVAHANTAAEKRDSIKTQHTQHFFYMNDKEKSPFR